MLPKAGRDPTLDPRAVRACHTALSPGGPTAIPPVRVGGKDPLCLVVTPTERGSESAAS